MPSKDLNRSLTRSINILGTNHSILECYGYGGNSGPIHHWVSGADDSIRTAKYTGDNFTKAFTKDGYGAFVYDPVFTMRIGNTDIYTHIEAIDGGNMRIIFYTYNEQVQRYLRFYVKDSVIIGANYWCDEGTGDVPLTFNDLGIGLAIDHAKYSHSADIRLDDFVVYTFISQGQQKRVLGNVQTSDFKKFGSIPVFRQYKKDRNRYNEYLELNNYNIGEFEWDGEYGQSFGQALMSAGILQEQQFQDWIVKIEDNDPYAENGESGAGNGEGTLSREGTDIDFPDLPTLSANDTGFITMFKATNRELKRLASYMWNSDLFSVDSWKKIFNNPIECILGLTIVPLSPNVGANEEIAIGNIRTGISLPKITSQWSIIDCGKLSIPEMYGKYLDYAPYTKIEIFLPFIGICPLKTDDVMNTTIHLKYYVDILSGACMAFLKVDGNGHNTILYSFSGQCAESIPITGKDMTNVINGIMSLTGSIGGMVATGGATAPQLANTARDVLSAKPHVEKSGNLSGVTGMLGVRKPYIIFTMPQLCIPKNQNEFMGYPSFVTRTLGEVSGYAEIYSIHISGINATDEEKAEIESLLISGVIL
ncbi:MAG: hypothetical protein MJZ34_14615 [Paludibacteraceae bacterium]|nr:hypothetical protein [Paludibacteraceae bacterium]